MTTAITTTAITVTTTRTRPMSESQHNNTDHNNSSILTASAFKAIPANTVEARICSSSAPVCATVAVKVTSTPQAQH